MWQDIIIAIANILFTYSLIHQVYHGFKNKKGFLTLTASGLTTIGLYAISVAYFTLSLYFSVVISFINGTLWLILFMQGWIYKNV